VDVPAWFTPGATAPTDSGEEQPGLAGINGTWSAYLHNQETGTAGYAAQTTSYVIHSGDTFNLSLLGAVGFTFTTGFAASADATMHYDLYYGGTATTEGTLFGGGYFDLGTGNGTPFTAHSISGIAAPGAAVGQVLGIQFFNSSGIDPFVGVQATGPSWIELDNVSLSVAPVPEPATLALVSLGGLALMAFRRRNA
jgi:hypothetical protein